MKNFQLKGTDSDDLNQRTIEVEEEKTVKQRQKITLAQRKQQANDLKNKIKRLVADHDKIIDEFDEIESNLSISIPEKPTRVKDYTPEKMKSEFVDTSPEWSSFQSHEFQAMDLGTKVTDGGKTWELIDKGQGHRKPSGQFGHHGWSEVTK